MQTKQIKKTKTQNQEQKTIILGKVSKLTLGFEGRTYEGTLRPRLTI